MNSRTGRAVTWMFTVSLAVLPSCGQVTVTVTGTVPGCIGAVHGVCRPVRSVNVPVGALQLYVTAQPIESTAVAVTVDTWPTSTVHGLHCARTVSVVLRLAGAAGGGGGGGGGAHIDPHARVIPQPELPARLIPRPIFEPAEEVVAAVHAQVPVDPGPRKDPVPPLPRQPERRIHRRGQVAS